MSKNKVQYYAVAIGKVKGIYTSWEECKKMVDGVVNAKFKKFGTREEAERFLKQGAAPVLSKLGIDIEIAPKMKDDDACSRDPSALIAFTDGSCIGNGSKRARAAYAVLFPNHPQYSCARALEGPMQTNNRAEYMACITALRLSGAIDPTETQTLHLYTDSMLLKKTVTEWIAAWKKRGWKRTTGEDIANLDLVKELDKLTQGRRIRWVHVEAHTGRDDWASRMNAEVDKMAQDAANPNLRQSHH